MKIFCFFCVFLWKSKISLYFCGVKQRQQEFFSLCVHLDNRPSICIEVVPNKSSPRLIVHDDYRGSES